MELNLNELCKFTLSANEIRQFSECPRKRYYSSRDCLAVRTNSYNKSLALGSAMHQMMQYYYTELQKAWDAHSEEALISIEDVQDWMDFEVKPFEAPEGLDAESLKMFNKMHELYKEQIAQDIMEFEIVGCEVDFSMPHWPIEDSMYHGQIDMIVRKRSDQKIYFFEHKTCKNFRPEIYNRFDIQLHIYAAWGVKMYGQEFGGMILNQIKKASTERGYGQCREEYVYSEAEHKDFFNWLKAKTEALASSDNVHAPCNNYMTCKMCEFATLCMHYGYQVPKTHQEITDGDFFVNEDGTQMYRYDPRDGDDEEE